MEKRFLYNGGKHKMGRSGLYSVFHWGNVLYIMEINKKRNEIYIQAVQTLKWAKRFIFSLPLEKRFIYNGDTQTEKWAVHNEVYIQSSIGETFYI